MQNLKSEHVCIHFEPSDDLETLVTAESGLNSEENELIINLGVGHQFRYYTWN